MRVPCGGAIRVTASRDRGPAPYAGELDPYRQLLGREPVGIEHGADRAGVADGRRVRAEPVALEGDEASGELGRGPGAHGMTSS